MTPDDVGMGRMAAMSKPDFVGKRSLSLPDLKRPGRKQLVGLLAEDRIIVPDEGEQIVASAKTPTGHEADRPRQFVLHEPDARPLVLPGAGRRRAGARLGADGVSRPASTARSPAKIVDPVFYDKEGRVLTPEAARRSVLDGRALPATPRE